MSSIERWSERADAPLDLPWYELLPKVAQIVDVVVRTPFVGSGLRGNTAAATAAVMYGHELGLGPMTSLNKLNVIDGSVAPSAELARALAMRVGEVWVEDENDSRVVVAARRHGSDVVHRVEWTIADARRAGLLGKRNWQTYPKAMLYARASAEIVRRVFPDVLGGITRVAEEIDDGVEPIEPDRQTVRRAKRTKTDEVARIEPQTALERPESDERREDASAQPPSEPPLETALEPIEQPPRIARLTKPTSGGRAPSKSQLDRLRVLVRAVGLADETQRAGKIELVGTIIGRDVESTNDLDAREASLVIDALTEVAEERADFGVTDDGRITIVEKRS